MSIFTVGIVAGTGFALIFTAGMAWWSYWYVDRRMATGSARSRDLP